VVFGVVGILSGLTLLYRNLLKIIRDTMVHSGNGQRVCVDDGDVLRAQRIIGRFRESCIVTGSQSKRMNN
jgi:hypothetical protein